MKLILSSCDFGNEESKAFIIKNLPKALLECRVLFIPNEKATPEIIKSNLYYDRLCSHGFSRENILVFDHTKPEKFRGLTLDVIYISGGNTFGTMDKLRKCDFCKDIIDYVKSGVIYIGGSAGAHIATQSIEHVARYDDNNVGLTDFNGLGLFDGILVCHYTYRRKAHLDELLAEGKYKVEQLPDWYAFIYEKNTSATSL